MEWVSAAIAHLPEASATPMALSAYLVAIIVGAVLTIQLWRIQALQKMVETMRPEERISTITVFRGEPLPNNISAKEWIIERRNRYLLLGFCVVLLTAIILFAIAATRAVPVPLPEAKWIGQVGWAYYEESNGQTTDDGVFRPVGATNSPAYQNLKSGMVLKSVHSFRLRNSALKDGEIIGTIGGGGCALVLDGPQNPGAPKFATSGGKLHVQIISCALPVTPKTAS